jgi:alkane 1-monooxygenase
MAWKEFKYLIAYIIPVSGYIAVGINGWVSYLTVIIAFILIPIFELILPKDSRNLSSKEYNKLDMSRFYNYLLYINVPLLYGLLIYFILTGISSDWSTLETIGKILSVGIVGGASGINVAHELGHKSGKFQKLAAKALLLPVLYLHFIIEHNRGHHLRVATPEDPATSRKDELVYTFWIRSIIGSYLSAWSLENKRLAHQKIPFWSLQNEMIVFMILEITYLAILFYAVDLHIFVSVLAIALVAILLLESINYIEHYGIVRKKLPSGRYEKVRPCHSWNSDHQVGRIILYELVRHSDHHYKANKKYQVLDSVEESPQLPLGYPTSILASLVPPLWFAIMNPLLSKQNN